MLSTTEQNSRVNSTPIVHRVSKNRFVKGCLEAPIQYAAYIWSPTRKLWRSISSLLGLLGRKKKASISELETWILTCSPPSTRILLS